MRKEAIITIDSGRDAGKTFHVSEMSASHVEKWAARALLVVLGGNGQMDNAQVKDLAKTSNASALVSVGLGALSTVSWEKVEPLYDELLPQVAIMPDADKPSVKITLRPANVDNHVEDVATLVRLRGEVLKLSLDFFGEGGGFASRLSELLAPLQGSQIT